MNYTPDPRYRDEALATLAAYAKDHPLHAVRIRTNRDGTSTALNVLAVGYMGGVSDVTAYVCQALQVKGKRAGVSPLTVSMNSGGTNPVTELQEALRRVIGEHVQVRES